MAEILAHRRPLPPIEGRESVVARASQVDWQTLDAVEGLLQGIIPMEADHHSQPPSDSLRQQTPQKPTVAEILDDLSGLQPPPSKKRRLMVSSNASAIAEDEAEHRLEHEKHQFNIRQTLLAVSPLSSSELSLEDCDDTTVTSRSSNSFSDFCTEAFPYSNKGPRHTTHVKSLIPRTIQGEEHFQLITDIGQSVFNTSNIRKSTGDERSKHMSDFRSESYEALAANKKKQTFPLQHDDTNPKDDLAVRSSSGSRTASEISPSQIENLLDIAQYGVDEKGRAGIHQSSGRFSANSFSREAAERWRSQDRHISNTVYGAIDVAKPRMRDLEADEDRLRQLTKLHRTATNPSIAQISDSGHENLPRTTTSNPRLISGLDMLASKRASSHSDLPVIAATGPVPPQTQLKATMLQLGDLTLPKNFDQLPPSRQDLIIEHERLKERIRDLEMLDDTYQAIAKLASFGDLSDPEQKELQQVRKYLILVLDEKETGKFRRRIIASIRDNMRRRAGKCGQSNSVRVDDWYRKLLGDQRIAILKQELERLHDAEIDLRSQRKEAKPDKKQRKQSKILNVTKSSQIQPQRTPTEARRAAQYAFQDRRRLEILAQLRLFDHKSDLAHPNALSLQNGEEEGEEQMQSQIDNASEISEDEAGQEFVFGSGMVGGENEFPYTPPSTPLPALRSTESLDNNLEDDRPIANGTIDHRTMNDNCPGSRLVSVPDQTLTAAQQDLLEEQYRREQRRKAELSENYIENAHDDFEHDLSDSESSTESLPDFAEPEDRIVQIYSIYGHFSGFPQYEVDEEHELQETYSVRAANKHMRAAVKAITYTYRRSAKHEPGFKQHRIEQVDGLDKHYLTFGQKDPASVVIGATIHSEEFNKKAYMIAKKRDIVRDQWIWNVYWQRTICKTKRKSSSTDIESTQNEDGDSDLRWDETIEEISHDQVHHFSNPVKANQHARQEFIIWYATYHQGPFHQRALNKKEDELEQYLERLGCGLWDLEDEFELPTSPLPGTDERVDGPKSGENNVEPLTNIIIGNSLDIAPGQDIDTTTNTPKQQTSAQRSTSEQEIHEEKVVTLEKYRVWVEKRSVWGPSN